MLLLPWSNDAWDMKSYRWNRLGPLEADLLWGPGRLDSQVGPPSGRVLNWRSIAITLIQ